MIIPKVGRGRISMTAPTPMQGEEDPNTPQDVQQALARPQQQSGIQVGGTTPQSSIVPQMPMNVQHPVAQLQPVQGQPQAPQASAQTGLQGMQKLMGSIQKAAGAQPGAGAAPMAQAAPGTNLTPQTAFEAAPQPAPAAPAAPIDATAGLLGAPPVAPTAAPTNLFSGLFGLLGGGFI